jgi:hypothetical protein
MRPLPLSIYLERILSQVLGEKRSWLAQCCFFRP